MNFEKGFIIVSSTVKDNSLLSKRDIKEYLDSLPIVDSKNPKHIEEVAGNHLRLIKNLPAGNDFCLNVIGRAKWKAKRNKIISPFKDYSEDYYSINVTNKFIKEYLSKCGDHHKRYNLWRQLSKDFVTWIVVRKGKDKIGEHVEKQNPFKINRIIEYDQNGDESLVQLLLLKDIYGSQIDDSCTKNGGEGFTKIPTFLFPKCTQTDKGNLGSYNPIYRSQIYSLSENTNCIDKINRPHLDFMKKVVPEYLDNNLHFKGGSEKRIKKTDLEKILNDAGQCLSKILPFSFVANNFSIGKRQQDVNISFCGIPPKYEKIVWDKVAKRLKEHKLRDK